MEIASAFTPSSMFATYSSFAAFYTLSQQCYQQFIPQQVREYIAEKVQQWLKKQPRLSPQNFTLIINQQEEDSRGWENVFYKACEEYLVSKIRTTATRLEGSRHNNKEPVTYKLTGGEQYVETFGTINLHWKFVCKNAKGEEDNVHGTHKCFELTFDHSAKDEILENYLPSVVLKPYDAMMAMKKDVYLHSYDGTYNSWRAVKFDHPFTFDALALEPELKQGVIDYLDRFLRRRDFYKRVGRAWKRGYLLYGPPGTGKSSLIAAMANYLRFDIYDLQLSSVADDATLRRLMLSTKNKSILVIEDIDCTMGLSSMSRVLPPSKKQVNSDSSDDDDDDDDDEDDYVEQESADKPESSNKQLSLSGLLNFVDGLWSSCGDERIIIFTTNHKERLDPALLRPGRMDMHIHMSYLTMSGFRALARNYLGVSEHALFGEIERLLEITNVSPAQIAEALTRSEDVDVALSGVVETLTTQKLKPSGRNGIKKQGTIKKRKQPAKVSAKPRTSKRQKKSTKAGSKIKPECC